MAAPPLEIMGKSHPLTVFSAVPVWYRFLLKAILFFFRHLPLTIVADIMFIHFAGWLPVNRNQWPRLSEEQPQEDLRDDYFLFTSNFNGPWDQYIDAFGLIHRVRIGLNLIWITSRGFPGAWPIRPFKRYIHYHEYALDLYFNAYPGMSVRDIKAATELSDDLDKFIVSAEQYDSADRFKEEFGHFVDSVAARLVSTGEAGKGLKIPSAKLAGPQGLQL